MNSNPLVSVIVPIYNVEKYIDRCIESIVNQTYKNLEIILVDDGSPDNCPKMCDDWAKKDSRIKVIHKENGGLSSARNAGISQANGEYLTIVDSDDWIDLNVVEICVHFATTKHVECVLFPYVKEYRNKSIKNNFLEKEQFFDEVNKDKVYRRIFGLLDEELKDPQLGDSIVTVWGKLYKTEFAKKGEYFDTKIVGSCEDGLFNIYALKDAKTFYYTDKCFYHYRKYNETSLTKVYRENLFEKWKNLFNEFQIFIDKNKLGNKYINALSNRVAISIIGLGFNEIANPNKKMIKTNLKIILNDDLFYKNLYSLNTKEMPIYWKLFFSLCKRKKIFFIVLFLKLMDFFKSRSK